MEEGYLWTTRIDNCRSIHIAELSRQSIIDNNAEHLGFDGYFIFETHDGPVSRGISILAKLASLDAAFSVLELWRPRQPALTA